MGMVLRLGRALPFFLKTQMFLVVPHFGFALFFPPLPAVRHGLCHVSLPRDPVRGSL